MLNPLFLCPGDDSPQACAVSLSIHTPGVNRKIHRGHAPAKMSHVATTKLALALRAWLVKWRRRHITRLCIMCSPPGLKFL